MNKTQQKETNDVLKEYVFYLEKIVHPERIGFDGFTKTIWAKSQEEATAKMNKSWGEQMGYSVKYLHTMEEFLAKKAED